MTQWNASEADMDTDNKAIFTVGMAAKMLDIHPRTLRNYEDKGLIVPARKGEWRYYTMRDIQWIECLREMIHVHGVSINAIKKLLKYTPCWNIIDCSFERRKCCSAFFSNTCVPKKIDRAVRIPRIGNHEDIAA
jgi:MerR family transcriptional regulator/heat shock protein HspR